MRNALALSGLFIIVLALCGLWMIAQIRAEVRDEIDAQLRLAHGDLAMASLDELRLWFRDEEEFAYYAEAYRGTDGTVLGPLRPEIFDQPGFQSLAAPDLFQPRFLSAFDRIAEEISAFEGPQDAFDIETWRVFVGPAAGGGQLAVFEPISGVEDALALIPRVMMVVGAALVATTLVAGAVMARLQQARLDRIRAGIARIGQGDLGHPMAPARLRDDLDEIMKGIDDAAAELDGSIARLRLFSQNVAHELRTPLARLRATLEQAPGTPDAALERTDEVIRILDAVHRIARLSHRPDPGTLTPVALADVVALTDDLFAAVAADAGQSLHVDLQAPAVVQGDFQLLAQMLSNLVENAIRYAGPGARITLRARGRALSVCDTGPGLSAQQDLTEPFARNTQSGEGAGLGLALVKTIARYHGATLTLSSTRGLEVQVSFPG